MVDGDLLGEQEMGNSHDPQAMAIKRWLMIPQLQVIGHVPKTYLLINLFDIHMRLYRCVKIWMVKTWRILGQLSIMPNFNGTKVSLYMVQLSPIVWKVWWNLLEVISCVFTAGVKCILFRWFWYLKGFTMIYNL